MRPRYAHLLRALAHERCYTGSEPNSPRHVHEYLQLHTWRQHVHCNRHRSIIIIKSRRNINCLRWGEAMTYLCSWEAWNFNPCRRPKFSHCSLTAWIRYINLRLEWLIVYSRATLKLMSSNKSCVDCRGEIHPQIPRFKSSGDEQFASDKIHAQLIEYVARRRWTMAHHGKRWGLGGTDSYSLPLSRAGSWWAGSDVCAASSGQAAAAIQSDMCQW